MEDKIIKCVDCSAERIFTVKDQEFFQEKKYSEPKRCKDCAYKKKQQVDRAKHMDSSEYETKGYRREREY